MLDVFVGEAFATRALSQTDTFAQRAIISFRVGGIEVLHRCTAGDAYWHAFEQSEATALLIVNCLGQIEQA